MVLNIFNMYFFRHPGYLKNKKAMFSKRHIISYIFRFQFLLFVKSLFLDKETQAWIITAITKILARSSQPSELFVDIDTSRLGFEARQRYAELKSILKLCSPTLLSDVLPYDGSCEDIEADPDLAFLDSFVQASLQNGARPYSKDHLIADRDDVSKANNNKPNKDQSLIFVYDNPPPESPKSYSQHQPQHHQAESVSAEEMHELPKNSNTNAVCSSPQIDDDFVYVNCSSFLLHH